MSISTELALPGNDKQLDARGTGSAPFVAATATAAVASVAAGLAHYSALGHHLPEDMVSAVAFTLLGAAQIIWPALLKTRDRWVLVTGIALSVASVAAWVVSRTVGLPIGHHAGEAEPVGLLDAGTAVAELVVVVAAVYLLRRRRDATFAASPPVEP
jgi:hypothetical protein